MNKNDIYGYLCRLIQKDHTDEIFSLYSHVLRSGLNDTDTIKKLLFYMYKVGSGDEYMMLLRRASHFMLTDSELYFYTAFYFILKKSNFHAYSSFSLVDRKDSPELYAIASANMNRIKASDKKIEAYAEEGGEDAERGRQIFAKIEILVRKTVDEIRQSDSSKKQNLFDI